MGWLARELDAKRGIKNIIRIFEGRVNSLKEIHARCVYFFISVSLHISLSPRGFPWPMRARRFSSRLRRYRNPLRLATTCKILSANISPGDPTPVPTYRCKSTVRAAGLPRLPRLKNFRIFADGRTGETSFPGVEAESPVSIEWDHARVP